MNTVNDGGPAFPRTRSQNARGDSTTLGDSCAIIDSHGGMTLRDYFAAQALLVVAKFGPEGNASIGFDEIADCCYRIADAMLSARAK